MWNYKQWEGTNLNDTLEHTLATYLLHINTDACKTIRWVHIPIEDDPLTLVDLNTNIVHNPAMKRMTVQVARSLLVETILFLTCSHSLQILRMRDKMQSFKRFTAASRSSRYDAARLPRHHYCSQPWRSNTEVVGNTKEKGGQVGIGWIRDNI